MGWVLVGVWGVVVVALVWRLQVLVRGLVAQVAVLTVAVHDVADKVAELDNELHAVDDGMKDGG